MNTFEELAASRREWIENVLKSWCQQAPRAELKKAALEWNDVAGRVDADATLWTWAWSRFPELVHEDLHGVNETCKVEAALQDGTTAVGFPDARQSRQGQLVLLCESSSEPHQLVERGPYSIDEIASIRRV